MSSLAARAEPTDKRPRAERVLEALRRHARRDLTWPLPGLLAVEFGVSKDTVQRAIADLIAQERLEWTGLRNGRVRVYRLLSAGSPQALVESPQPAAADRTAGAPLGATPAVVSARTISPQEEEDRAHLDSFEWTPALRDDYAARARAMFERLSFGDERPEFEQLGEGDCEDCHRPATRRERYGKFALCLQCVGRRHSVGLRLATDVAAAEGRP